MLAIFFMMTPLTLIKSIFALLLGGASLFLALCGLGILPMLKGKVSDTKGKIGGVLSAIAAILLLVTFIRGIIPAINIGGGSSSSSDDSGEYGSYSNPVYIYEGSTFNKYDTINRKGGEVWFTFTPNNAGTYRFFVEECDKEYEITLYDKYRTYLTSVSSDYSYSEDVKPGTIEYKLDSYATYYLRVYLYGKDKSFEMNVEKAPGPESSAMYLTLGSSQYFNVETPEYDKWFTFTTSDYGNYDVRVWSYGYTNVYLYKNTVDNYVSSNSGSPDSSKGYKDYAFNDLDSFTTYYVRVAFTGYESSPQIMVQKNDPRAAAVEATLGDNSVNVSSDKSSWLKFTPSTSGAYAIMLKADNNTTAKFYAGSSTSYDKSVSFTGEKDVLYDLTAGTTYYIELSSTYSNYSVEVDVAKVNDVSLGSNSTGHIKMQDRTWYRYTASSGNYLFKTDSSADVNITLYDSNLSYLTSGSMVEYNLYSGNTYYICVEGNDYYGYDSSFSLDLFQMNTLYTGATSTNHYSTTDKKWFKFTSSSAGYYSFTNDSEYGTYTTLYNQYFEQLSAGISVNYNLDSYTTYYLCVEANDSYYDGNFYVYYNAFSSLSSGSNYTGLSSVNDKKWYSFYVYESANYVFTTDSSYDVVITLYDYNMNYVTSGETITSYINSYSNYYISIQADNYNYDTDFYLYANQFITLSANYYNYNSISYGGKAYYSFTPSSSGYYNFTSGDLGNSSYANIEILDQNGNLIAYNYSGASLSSVYLDGYDNYSVVVYYDYSDYVDSSFYVYAYSAVALTANEYIYHSIPSGGQARFTFTPAVSAYYSITYGDLSNYSSANIYIYYESGSVLTYNYSSPTVSSVYLEYGYTYSVVIDYDYTSYYDNSFYLYVTCGTVATLGSYNYNSISSGGVAYFVFTPTSSGYYNFSTGNLSNANYANIVIYSQNGSVLASNNSSANYTSGLYLSYGYTYLIGVYYDYTSYSDSSFYLYPYYY